MARDIKHRLYMGFRGLMLRVPLLVSKRGSRIGERGARENAERLTDEERRVHHHTVLKMMSAREPFTAGMLAKELGIESGRMEGIVDKLERMKTFLYRSDGTGIDWAYPLSLDDTGFRLTASTGEQFNAA